jgi:uncharacterized membrane protein
MKIINPIKINDWRFRRVFILVICLQLALVGLVFMDSVGFNLTFLRILIGLIYLLLIPGMLILRILKLHKLNIITNILYSVGLSLATLMFIGFFINFLYPFLGLNKPISLISLMITIFIINSILLILSFICDRDFCEINYIDVNCYVNLWSIVLCIIPFFTLFAVYLVNYNITNIMIILLILFISFVFIAVANKTDVPEYVYPLAILVISISLLYHTSLISNYIWGWDIYEEYYLANNVIRNEFWDHSSLIPANGMLAIVMLMPIFSLICNISLTWILKVLYPLLFSLVPLGLFFIFKRLTNNNFAFMSAFFFVSFTGFYFEMLSLPRQQMAEFFLVLLVLSMLDESISIPCKSVLSIIFCASLIVSHYSLTYIYLFSISFTWILLKLYTHLNNSFDKFGINTAYIENKLFSITFITFVFSFTLSWYIYICGSSAINPMIFLVSQIKSNFLAELLSPESSAGLNTFFSGGSISPLHSLTKYLHILSLVFISFGIILPFTKHINKIILALSKDFYFQSLSFFALCVFSVVVPNFLMLFSTARIYQITLVFLSPFCVIGGIVFLQIMFGIVKKDLSIKSSTRLLSLILVILFFFNVGFIFELTNDHPTSISLSLNNPKNSDDVRDNLFSCVKVFDQDIFASGWLQENIDESKKNIILTDDISKSILISYGSFNPEVVCSSPLNISREERGSTIFMGYVNIVKDILRYKDNFIKTSNSYSFTSNFNKVYSSGSDEILNY